MTQCTATFETGTNGNAVLVADAGSATAWDTKTLSSGAITYSNTHAVSGSLSMKGVTGAGAQSMEWNTAMGSVTDHYTRIYLWIDALPTGNFFFQAAYGAASALTYRLLMQAAGFVIIQPGSGGTQSGAVQIATGQWVRIESHTVNSATVGSVEVKLFNTATSATATETIQVTGRNTLVATTSVRFGDEEGGGAVSPYYMDNIVAGAASYPGPYPVNSVAPAVSGLTPVGSTLTATTGTWNTTFTYTYQWTRDGSNIGSATASTYVTVSADIGHAIACNVTATGTVATNESATQASSNSVTATAASSHKSTSSYNPRVRPHSGRRGSSRSR